LNNYKNKYSKRDGQLEIDDSALNDIVNIRIDIKTKEQLIKDKKSQNNDIDAFYEVDQSSMLTDFILIRPFMSKLNKPLKLRLNLNKRQSGSFSSNDVIVYRINSDLSLRTKIESNVENNYVRFNVQQTGGTFFVQKETNNSLLAGLLFGLGLLLVFFGFVGIYLYKNPQYFRRARYMACNVKRSMANEI
jgi:hypothetical protein